MNIVDGTLAAALLASAAWKLSRTLPLQNIAMIVGCLMAVEGALHLALPGLGWIAVLFWPAAILWARIFFRWLLRLGRQNWNYGIWLIVLASAATGLLQWAVELLNGNGNATMQLAVIRVAEAA